MATEVKVPDIGDFTDIPVVSVLVAVGDKIEKEDPLIELESDKATMEVPSSAAGTVKEIKLKEGDTASEGTVVLLLEDDAEGGGKGDPEAGEVETKPGKQDPDRRKPGEDEGGAAGKDAPRAGTATEEGKTSPAAADKAKDAPSTGTVTDAGFGKIHASPSVRAFARRVDVDLNRLDGTGRKGRVLQGRREAPAPAAAPKPATPSAPEPAPQTITMAPGA